MAYDFSGFKQTGEVTINWLKKEYTSIRTSRAMLYKMVKEKLEEARIRVRAEREKNLNNFDKKEKSELGEDDKFRLKNELQKLVDDLNRQLEELATKKEKEILE